MATLIRAKIEKVVHIRVSSSSSSSSSSITDQSRSCSWSAGAATAACSSDDAARKSHCTLQHQCKSHFPHCTLQLLDQCSAVQNSLSTLHLATPVQKSLGTQVNPSAAQQKSHCWDCTLHCTLVHCNTSAQVKFSSVQKSQCVAEPLSRSNIKPKQDLYR